MKRITLSIGIAVLISVNFFAQRGRTYLDGHGGHIFLPYGNISFADQAVYCNSGNPAPSKEDKNPEKALGIPDYNKEKDINFTSGRPPTKQESRNYSFSSNKYQ